MLNSLPSAIRELFAPTSSKTLFDDPIYAACMEQLLKPKFRYYYPREGTRKPPLPSFIFGSLREGEDSFTRQLLEASKEAAPGFAKGQGPRLFCMFGRDTEGRVVWEDFTRIRQLLVTGSSGGGKSTGVASILLSMMWAVQPELLQIEIFDLKGDFLAFRPVATVRHNIDPEKAAKGKKDDDKQSESPFLQQIRKCEWQMRGRSKRMSGLGYRNIEEWNDALHKCGKPLVPYRLIVIDEYASTVGEVPGFKQSVEAISARGRSAGFYTIIATQRADAEAISSRIKTNVLNNLSFAQRDAINARVAGVPGAELLSEPGQAILAHDLQAVRLATPPYLTGKAIDKYVGQLAAYGLVFAKGGKPEGEGITLPQENDPQSLAEPVYPDDEQSTPRSPSS